MTDAQNRGDRSDRFTVRWDLDREPPFRLEAADGVAVLAAEGLADAPSPRLDLAAILAERERPVLVQVPREYQRLRDAEPELASRWRDASAEAIEACLASGRVASGFTRDSAYVFT